MEKVVIGEFQNSVTRQATGQNVIRYINDIQEQVMTGKLQ
jgi:hypothetical protein